MLLFALCLFAEPDLGGAADRPYVEITRSEGAIDGEPGAPWQRVRVQIHVTNHLPATVDQLAVAVDLVSKEAGRADEVEPIAGWRFDQMFTDEPIEASHDVVLRIDRTLPSRRRVHDPNDIAYRVTVIGYRVVPPSLDLALRLIESSDPGDQRAALQSYERLIDAPPGVAEMVAEEIARAIASPPQKPDAKAALRLLLALRAAGDLGLPAFLPLLLSVPEKIRAGAWGPALGELAARLLEASEPGEPRLEVLPAWARGSPNYARIRGEDLIAAAARESALRLGDRAVPDLVRAAALGETDGIRGLAASVLAALGRGTVRSQLTIDDRDARLRLIDVYGEIGAAEPVAALAELLGHSDGALTSAASATLVKIGAPAIAPLVDALATPDREVRRAILDVIEAIGPAAKDELAGAARRYAVLLPPGIAPRAAAEKLAEHLAAGARARWSAELTRALSLARSGHHDEAFRMLDAIYAADPELYLSSSKTIARLYVDRANELFQRGNYDAVIDTLRVGRTIEILPEMDSLLRETELTLARGYLALDQLDRAEQSLEHAEMLGAHAEIRALRARVLARKSELSIESGDYARARAEIDRARTLDPENAEIRRVNRRLSLDENIPILLVLSLMVPGGLLSVVLMLRRRAQAARLARMIRE